MNRGQRDKNRGTAKWLRHQQRCTRCGLPGLHYVSLAQPLDAFLLGLPAGGFWTCPDLYGPDGRRLEP